ncbi:hypothetical protein ACLF6K_23275 [Streptomyces xanthophaeus]|uniref:hypothetical protein n=1 Tax=Streptomyces xanthophaeus TaxID=67385 RepID=UPI00398FDCE2
MAELITKCSAEFPEAAFTVFSFHHRVLGRDGDLALLDQQITTHSLRDHVPHRVGQPGSSWPEQLMPIGDALNALEEALRRAQRHPGPRSSVLKTDLRTHLTVVEPRFDPRYPLARTPRLISMLLQEAQERGMILQFGREPQISVALRESTEPSAAIQATPVPQPQSARVSAPTATPAAAVPATAVAAAGVPAQARAPQPIPDPATATRSWHFANVLRQRRLGPYPEVRHDLYDQIITIARENQGSSSELTVRALARQAVTATRSAAPDRFPRRKGESLPKDMYDWRGLENFAVQVLSRTELALGEDGEPLPRDASIWSTRQAPVRQPLPDDVDIMFDAELVYEIVRDCLDVTPDDIVHLAGAMLGGRSVQNADHVERVLDHLLRHGRIKGEPGTERLLPTESASGHDRT